ncbi:MAG: hypothetical protein ACK55R_13110 [Cyanobacteriota bacterium]
MLSDKLFYWLFQSRPDRILNLVALSERLDGKEILSLDGDFDVYRRFRREPVERIMIR